MDGGRGREGLSGYHSCVGQRLPGLCTMYGSNGGQGCVRCTRPPLAVQSRAHTPYKAFATGKPVHRTPLCPALDGYPAEHVRACKTINDPFRLVLLHANGVKKPRRSPTMPTFFALLAHKITSSILYHLLFCKPLDARASLDTHTVHPPSSC